MEIFLNINHAQSIRGFRLTRMDAQRLTDVVSPNEVPYPAFSFLSEDLFRAIWCDIAPPEAFSSKDAPVWPSFGFFGVKGLRGVYDRGLSGFIDVVFCAGADGINALAGIVNRALSAPAAFSALLFSCVTVDVNGDYACNRDALYNGLNALDAGTFPPFVTNPELRYRKPCDLVHFAACAGSRERAEEVLGVRPTLFRRRTGLMDADEFDAFFRY